MTNSVLPQFLILALLLTAQACGGNSSSSKCPGPFVVAEQSHPTPIALGIVADPAELDRDSYVEDLLRDVVAPGQNVVVASAGRGPAGFVHVVQPHETLWDLSQLYRVPFPALLQANPALGPLGGRDYSKIWSGDRVFIPTNGGGDLLLAEAAPAPTRAVLVSPIPMPSNPNSYTRTSVNCANQKIASDNADKIKRAADADHAAIARWIAEIMRKINNTVPSSASASMAAVPAFSSAVAQVAGSVHGLAAESAVVVVRPRRIASAASPAAGSLNGVALVIAGVDDPAEALKWREVWSSSGAKVVTFDSAQVQLKKPSEFIKRMEDVK